MIIRGREHLFPAEIEQVLFTHPGVAAVVRPHDPQVPPTAAELHAHCRRELAPAKTPASWFVAAEPLTGSGRSAKFRVRELLDAGAYGPLG